MTSIRTDLQQDFTSVLTKITSAVVGHFNMKPLLEAIIDTTMKTLQAQACSIYLEDKLEPGILKCVAGTGFATTISGHAQYRIGEGLTGTVVKTGEEFNIKNEQDLQKLKSQGIWCGKHDHIQWKDPSRQFRNLIAVPLKIKEQTIGVIKAENKIELYGQYFTDEDLINFRIIGNVIALTIENVRLHQKTEEQLKTISAKAAHRINNQLTNFDDIELRLTDYSNEKNEDYEMISKIAINVKETTRNLKRLVEEFKNFGKPLRIERVKCDFNNILRHEIWLSKPPNGITIEEVLDPSIPEALVDAGRFAEAVKELLSNSIKALDRHKQYIAKRITVETKSYKQGSKAMILLQITDNGPGIPPNFPIFEPFQTTDPQSTGLGLVTVKELVEAHGGTIEVKTSVNEGVRITIGIPVE